MGYEYGELVTVSPTFRGIKLLQALKGKKQQGPGKCVNIFPALFIQTY
jgi:hypothetical protein